MDANEPRRPTVGRRRPNTLIVISGPRDGAGRTSLAAHMSVALLMLGRDTGVVDLVGGRDGLAMWLARREQWVAQSGAELVSPASLIASGPVLTGDDREQIARWADVLSSMGKACDTVIVDAPSGDGALVQRLHEDADVIITLAAESTLDLDGLFELDRDGRRSRRPAAYARTIWEARRRRGRRGESASAWFIVRGRALAEGREMFDAAFHDAAGLLGASAGPRVRENILWRNGMEKGLTALDPGAAPTEKRKALAAELRRFILDTQIPGLEGAEFSF